MRAYSDPAYSKTRGWRELAAAITRLSAGLPPERVRVAQNFPDPTLWYYYRGPVEHLVLPPQANDAAGARSVAQALAEPGHPACDSAGAAGRQLGCRRPGHHGARRLVRPRRADYRRGCGRCKSTPSRPAPSRQSMPHSRVASRCAATWLRLTPLRRAGCSRFTSTGHLRAQARRTRQARRERKVFVQLLDAGGQLVAQDDRPLVLSAPRAAGSGLAVYGLILPAELGAGPYQLITGIYDPTQEGAPRLKTKDRAPTMLRCAGYD